MGAIDQAKRLLSLDRSPASGNAFIALTALSGLVGWGVTVWAVHLVLPMPTGGAIAGPEVGQWAQRAMAGLKWPVTAAWLLAWVGRIAWGYARVERGAVVNTPMSIWFGASLVALTVNVYAVWTSTPELVWLPWMVVFAVGYLSTAVLVRRAGVYWAAGIASSLLVVHGLYSILTGTGYAVLGPASALSPALASTVGPGTVLMPLPYTYGILGLLQVVPMAVDAARGGRELAPSGVPRLRADDDPDDDNDGSAGGVVPT